MYCNNFFIFGIMSKGVNRYKDVRWKKKMITKKKRIFWRYFINIRKYVTITVKLIKNGIKQRNSYFATWDWLFVSFFFPCNVFFFLLFFCHFCFIPLRFFALCGNTNNQKKTVPNKKKLNIPGQEKISRYCIRQILLNEDIIILLADSSKKNSEVVT